MVGSSRVLSVGSVLALAAISTLSAGSRTGEKTANVAAASTLIASVKCLGVTNIPFTADAEQALPLRLVGFLACGETVTVLSEGGAYTARIRAKDGREGYVALIYLSSERSTAPPPPKAPPSPAQSVNGIVRWSAGAAGCDEFLSHGRHVESITANGITVQVSLQDTGWKYRANVAVSNQSGETVEVVPGIVTLDELTPNLRSLLAVNPEKLFRTPTHQVWWTLADAVPSRSAVANYSANVSETDRLANRTSPAPDYLNPHLALASTRHAAFDRAESLEIESIALKPGSLPSGQLTAGVMWFDRDSSAHELSFRVPVGDLVFDFAFSLEEKK
jgi:hypothetical protein